MMHKSSQRHESHSSDGIEEAVQPPSRCWCGKVVVGLPPIAIQAVYFSGGSAVGALVPPLAPQRFTTGAVEFRHMIVS